MLFYIWLDPGSSHTRLADFEAFKHWIICPCPTFVRAIHLLGSYSFIFLDRLLPSTIKGVKGRLEFFQNFIQFVPLILLYTSPHTEIHLSIHPTLSVHLLHQGATSVWDGIIGRAFISAALFDATQTLFGCSVTPTNIQPTTITTTKKRRGSVMVQTPLLWQARCGFLLKEIMPSWV